ncbi:hypothetical protein [Pelagicoccus mobilis]|uniref:Adenylyltransferase SoFic-like C-terminal domain-containing protein n=1 Tax=Pelagicoccus mobilis TaxID=415221 RepID=A0A934RTB8_9BACT|nr:hypothetical protein [Pelagicoccus mobilis]MBK1877210.1 hypothetical protein [Pelagicoccus mobilis]
MKELSSTPTNPLLQIPNPKEIETREILKECIEARASLAYLSRVYDSFKPQKVLFENLATIETLSVLTKSKAFETARFDVVAELKKLYVGQNSRSKLRDIHLFLQSSHQSTWVKKPSVIELYEEAAKTVMLSEQDEVFTAMEDLIDPNNAHFKNVSAWVDFELSFREDHLDPLINQAISHVSFRKLNHYKGNAELIGSLADPLTMKLRKLLSYPCLTLHHYFFENKDEYEAYLSEFRQQGHWRQWVSFYCSATSDRAQKITRWSDQLVNLYSRTAHQISRLIPANKAKDITELIFTRPFCQRNDVELCPNIADNETLARHLKRLVEHGILEQEKHSYTVVYRNRALVDLILEAIE